MNTARLVIPDPNCFCLLHIIDLRLQTHESPGKAIASLVRAEPESPTVTRLAVRRS